MRSSRLYVFLTAVSIIAAASLTPAPGATPVSAPPGDGMEFVRIPPGEFMMGCAEGDNLCFDQEQPQHRVRITKAFEIGKFEVTQAQWKALMKKNPSKFSGNSLPVDSVSWLDAQAFLDKLNESGDGRRYRLPTDAEWEYAARAGTSGKTYGPSLNAIAWFIDTSDRKTHPGGQKEPNPWGLYDMMGNVWEWVSDWYDVHYYSNSPEDDPTGPADGQYKVVRGGSWFSVTRLMRLSTRGYVAPANRVTGVGFRCVRELSER